MFNEKTLFTLYTCNINNIIYLTKINIKSDDENLKALKENTQKLKILNLSTEKDEIILQYQSGIHTKKEELKNDSLDKTLYYIKNSDSIVALIEEIANIIQPNPYVNAFVSLDETIDKRITKEIENFFYKDAYEIDLNNFKKYERNLLESNIIRFTPVCTWIKG